MDASTLNPECLHLRRLFARDRGRTWEDYQVVVSDRGVDQRDASILQLASGKLIMHWFPDLSYNRETGARDSDSRRFGFGLQANNRVHVLLGQEQRGRHRPRSSQLPPFRGTVHRTALRSNPHARPWRDGRPRRRTRCGRRVRVGRRGVVLAFLFNRRHGSGSEGRGPFLPWGDVHVPDEVSENRRCHENRAVARREQSG